MTPDNQIFDRFNRIPLLRDHPPASPSVMAVTMAVTVTMVTMVTMVPVVTHDGRGDGNGGGDVATRDDGDRCKGRHGRGDDDDA